MATYDYPLIANFGVANAGRADVYVEVQSVDGTVRIARTLTGVTEWQDDNANDTGIYELVATLDDTWGPLRVMWDVDGVAGAMAAEVLQQPVALLPDAVDDLQTAATNALNAYDPPTKAEMDAAFALLNDLDSAAVAAAALSALASYDPPTKAEMDSGFAALNDLDAAGVRTALGMASANLDTQLAAIPTVAEIIDAYKAIGVDDLDMMEFLRVLLWCAISNTTGLSNGYGTMTVFKRDGSSTCFTAAIDQHGNRTITIVDLS